MIKKLVIIGIVLLLVGVAGVSAQQMNSDIGTGQNVRAWSTSWVDNGNLINEAQSIKAVPICEDNAVMYVYESDIAPDSPTSMNQWTTSTADLGLPLNIQQTQTVPYYHSSNMVLDTDNATVQKYCNPPPLPVLH